MLYDVFLSYSHAADGRLAPALQSGLQQFARPWNRLRALRVFRDKTGLSANPALWSAIEMALESSQNFVLLASPGAACSPWVQKEVEHWLTRSKASKMLLVLTDGEITWDADVKEFDWKRTTALSPSLRGRFPEEPLWVDLRWAQKEEDLSLQNPAFREAVADLSSGLRQIPKDQLIGEDVRQHRKGVLFRRSAIVSLVVLALALACAAFVALGQRNLARTNEVLAHRNEQTAKENADRAVTNQAKAEQNESLAREREATALQRLYVSQMNLAYHAWEENNPALTYELLNAHLADPGHEDLRSFDWYYLWRVSHSYLANIIDTDSITAVAAAPDGGSVATASAAGKVRLYNPEGHLKQELPATSRLDQFNHLAFASVNTLVGCTRSGLERIWDLKTSGEFRDRRVSNVRWGTNALSADGRIATYWATSGHIVLDSVIEPGPPSLLQPPQENISAIAVSRDGRMVAVVGGNGEILVTEPDNMGHLSKLGQEKGALESVTFTPDATQIATGSIGGELKLWDVKERKMTRTLGVPDSGAQIRALTFSDDGRFLAAATQDATGYNSDRPGLVVVWDRYGTKRIYRGHLAGVTSVSFAPRGRFLVSATDDKTTKLWDSNTDQASLTLKEPGRRVLSVAVSDDGSRIVTAGEGSSSGGPGDVDVWDVDSRKHLCSMHGHSSGVNAVAFYSTNKVLSTSSDGTVRLWDADCGGSRGVLTNNPSFPIYSVTVDRARHQFATVGGHPHGVAQIWDLEFLRPKAEVPLPLDNPSSVAFSDKGGWLAVGSMYENSGNKQTLALLKLPAARDLGLLEDFSVPTHALAFSQSGDTLVVGWADHNKPGDISLWDLNPLQYRGRIRGNYMAISSLVFTPDGRSLISTSGIGLTENAGEIKVWDLALMQERATLAQLPTSILHAALSADGHTLAAVTSENSLYVWRAATERDVLSSSEALMLASPFDPGRILNFARACWGLYRQPTKSANVHCLIRAERSILGLKSKGVKNLEVDQWLAMLEREIAKLPR